MALWMNYKVLATKNMCRLLVLILTANAHDAGLTQGSLVRFGVLLGGACWRAFIVVVILIVVAILPDFAEQPEEGVLHLFLGKTREVKLIVLAAATGLSKGSHDHCPPLASQPVAEQHHHPCWRPGLTAWSTLEAVGEMRRQKSDRMKLSTSTGLYIFGSCRLLYTSTPLNLGLFYSIHFFW